MADNITTTEPTKAATSELLGNLSESIYGCTADALVANGWPVFPQDRYERKPSKLHGRVICPKSEAHVDEVIPSGRTLEDWKLFCACENAAVMFGPSTAGLFAVDADILDARISDEVVAIAEEHLGPTSFMRVGKAPKIALFYRTSADDLVSYSAIRLADESGMDSGNVVELLSSGRTITIHGRHHKTGNYYKWIGDSSPLINHVSEVPEVSSEQVEAFLRAVAERFPVVKASRYSEGHWAEGYSGRVRAAKIVRDENTPLAKDGREEILRDLVWRTTRANGRALIEADSGEALDSLIRDVAAAVAGSFSEAAVCDGRWAPSALRVSAGKAVTALAGKIRSGDVKPPCGQGVVVGEDGEPRALPIVQLEVGDIANAVDAAEAALVSAGRGVYQRAGKIVQIGEVTVKTAEGAETSAQRIFQVDESALLEHVSVAARFERYDAKANEGEGGWRQVTPPSWIAATMASRAGRLSLPVLSGVIGAPTLRPDGSVLDQPGYDEATGLLFDPRGVVFPAVPAKPTREQAKVALGKLQKLISTFPFVTPEHSAVAMACMLTAVVRRSLPAAPGFGYSAPTAGSGKSKLVDIASIMATGREAGVISQGSKEEEDEKRISSLLLDGSSILALDNCERPVSSALLCQILTQSTVRPRILGKSEAPEVPCSMLVALTGNNLITVGDLNRRILRSMLDAGVERPETREFSNDPVADAKAQRGELVVAALTVLRAYRVAGQPVQAAPLGSFGAWSRTVRDAMLWLGCADPVKTLDEARAHDPKLASLESVIGQWLLTFGKGRISGRDLIASATEQTPLTNDGRRAEFVRPDLREALLAVAEAGGAINSRRLSQWLSGQVGRIVGGAKIVRDGVAHGGVQLWRLDLDAAAEAAMVGMTGPSQLEAEAARCLPTDEDAVFWMRTPSPDLDGHSPYQAATSHDGLARAQELLQDRAAGMLQLQAVNVLGDDAAGTWLWATHPALGRTPLEECRDGQGHRRVHQLLATHAAADSANRNKVIRLTR